MVALILFLKFFLDLDQRSLLKRLRQVSSYLRRILQSTSMFLVEIFEFLLDFLFSLLLLHFFVEFVKAALSLFKDRSCGEGRNLRSWVFSGKAIEKPVKTLRIFSLCLMVVLWLRELGLRSITLWLVRIQYLQFRILPHVGGSTINYLMLVLFWFLLLT